MTNNVTTTTLSWVDGDGREGVDFAVGQALPTWAEPFLVERTDKPGAYETIELSAGPRHLVLIPRALLLEEQSRRPAKLFCVPDTMLARLTRLQRAWLDERRVETDETSGTVIVGLVIDLAEMSTDDLHVLESFYQWVKNHAHEHEKRYNSDKNNLSTS